MCVWGGGGGRLYVHMLLFGYSLVFWGERMVIFFSVLIGLVVALDFCLFFQKKLKVSYGGVKE